MSEFDRSINIALDKRLNKKVQFTVKAEKKQKRMIWRFFFLSQGKLSTYRFCDNVWTLVLKDFAVKDSGQAQHNAAAPPATMPHADKVKIVACDAKSMRVDFFPSSKQLLSVFF